MQAIILAAGMGKRLKELTKNNTKCMVKVNGQTLIERLLFCLDKKHLSKIIIVVGYKGQELISYIEELNIQTEIVFINNPIYNKTNNIYSLSLADSHLMAEDTLLFESDLVFDEIIVDKLLSDGRENLAVVDKFESWMDGTCMVLDENDNITDFISGKRIDFSNTDTYYKTVNIYKFSRYFSENIYVPFLEAYRKAMGQNEYYESVIKLIAMLGTNELKAMRLKGEIWYEIDDAQDLDIAETLFTQNLEEKYKKISERFGGFWRYPKLLDFCYLINPYFPTKRMIQEIGANLNMLIRNYPSGMRVNSLLASRNFSVRQEHIVIGNGAAELIKILMETLNIGRIGMVRPTFEEYPNRYISEKINYFHSEKDDFSYTVKDLIDYYDDYEIDSFVLINPDNPIGNYINSSEIMDLINWAKQKKINLIIDESFSDFVSTDRTSSLISENILSIYDRLYLVKSISKSYGVAGLRLGVLASADEYIIAKIKKNVSIWNINSIAEFYMQIYEKYEKDYQSSLDKIIKSREKMIDMLQQVSYLRVFPTQANYVCCEVLNGISANEVAQKLLAQDILIKCLTSKIGNGREYIRLAVRTEDENFYLIEKLKNLFEESGNNRWKEIWNHRKIDWTKLDTTNEYEKYKELKRIDGFDVNVKEEKKYYKCFYNTICEVFESELRRFQSVYEVGCGSGANLIVFKNRGMKVGGLDYSAQLIEVAKKILPKCDLIVDDAKNVTNDEKYDVVISDSVFAYFPNEEYAKEVLKKMYAKATSKIILLEIFDKDTEAECNEKRRSAVKNYDEKYAGLNKVFYSKQMFMDFAKEHDCKVKFTKVNNEYYWNSRYMYNCIIYK